jgi:ADP-ribosylglycohydrolase
MITSISPDTFHDKVYGCWMGKNSGGTLGAPLEKGFGEAEPFDVWWYPRLQEGGIPNDDLELQLIWLLALEEVGPALQASDLAQYWLDYVGYNWDEYGFHKVNLRLGLQPPVSSVNNNWFTDCMGCPIRSEIWACIAPGFPHIAVRYAYEDAIVDHAGGEGVYGELFNTAIQSAAFVVSDPGTLLEIGLSYVPEESQTYAAISAAIKAHGAGDDWKQARRRVLEATPHYNSQYSPVNMAFQAIGWLYGQDYGDAICKAVNCGYDTDCTGATLGSYLGIVAGRSGLPAKWLEPLGTVIATNASWGGLRNIGVGKRKIPLDIIEFTDRTVAVAERVLSYHGASLAAIPTDLASLKADEDARTLWRRNPWRLDHRTAAVHVGVEYPRSATIAPGQVRRLVTCLENPHPAAIELRVGLQGGAALTVTDPSRVVVLGPQSEVTLAWDIAASGPLEISNRLDLSVAAGQRPAVPTLPIILLGAHRWRLLGPLPADGKSDHELLETVFEPEIAGAPLTRRDARPGLWREIDAETNDIPFPAPLTRAGVLYAQAFTWNPVARPIRIGAPCNACVKVWLNGKVIIENSIYRPYRPNYDGSGDGPTPYADLEIPAGWSEIFLKFARGDAPLIPPAAKFAAALLLADPTELNAGLTDQLRTRFPWDAMQD